jgi:DNA-binding transcriptional LysR family regulator
MDRTRRGAGSSVAGRGWRGVELRQFRYFVTLAEELHFGRAAAREHIVQSALSQQVQRLERELGVRLLDRSTHPVALTAAGAVFLAEVRQILAHMDRAAGAARSAVGVSPTLRVGIIDSSYDSMPQILHEVQARYPDLVVHQVEASVPEQYQQVVDGRLDVGIGRQRWPRPRWVRTCSAETHSGSWSPAVTGSPIWTRYRSPPSPRSRCCSPKRCRHRSSTSSPWRCAEAPVSRRPCTREPSRASARPPIWSPRDAACTACRPPASPRCPQRSGDRSPNRPADLPLSRAGLRTAHPLHCAQNTYEHPVIALCQRPQRRGVRSAGPGCSRPRRHPDRSRIHEVVGGGAGFSEPRPRSSDAAAHLPPGRSRHEFTDVFTGGAAVQHGHSAVAVVGDLDMATATHLHTHPRDAVDAGIGNPAGWW